MFKFCCLSFFVTGQEFGQKEIELNLKMTKHCEFKEAEQQPGVACTPVPPVELKFAVVIKKFRFNSLPSSTGIYFDVNEISTT